MTAAAASARPSTAFDASPSHAAIGARLGRAAVAALHDELALEPKPGLVSFADNGSHDDMDARTFMRSLFALRRAFVDLTMLGADGAPFDALQSRGIAAESRMLQATGGVNTHRGAIFTLGLLCAAGGSLLARGGDPTSTTLRTELRGRWGDALVSRAGRITTSNGRIAASRHGLRGAGDEAAAGFPVLFETTWPALRSAIDRGIAARDARIDALFATIAVLDDTNVVHRGGLAALRHVQRAAASFIAAGGAARPDGLAQARSIHRDFVVRRLSPGGAADLLAAACWLHRIGAGR